MGEASDGRGERWGGERWGGRVMGVRAMGVRAPVVSMNYLRFTFFYLRYRPRSYCMEPLRCWRTFASEDNLDRFKTVYLHFLTATLVKLAGPARAWSRPDLGARPDRSTPPRHPTLTLSRPYLAPTPN